MDNSKFTDISDKKFLTSTMNFYNNCKSPDVKKMDDLDDLVNSLVADAEAGADGGLRKSDLKDGLQHLLVTPRWRKNTPNNTPKANSTSNIAVLSRLSTGQQEYILREITNLYIPDSADQDKQVQLPTDYSNLDQLINNGIQTKQKAIQAEIDAKNYQLKITDSLAAGEFQYLASTTPEYQKIKDEIKNLEDKLKEQQQKNATLKKHLQDEIIKDLQPINAETMAEGYVYIFLQDSKVEGYAELSLYKEYKSSITNDNTFYAEVDISEYKDCDYRVADADSAKAQIPLPACYAKDQATYKLQKVVVLFSTVQLSSARLAKIESDSKLQTQHTKTLNSSNLKDSFDMSLVENISHAKAKARDIKYNYQDNGATQTQWTELEVYPIYNYNRKTIGWNLLLDNPLGVMNNNNFAIDWLQTQLSNVCVQIQADNYGKSSILIANFLFNPQASGLISVDMDDMDHDDNTNPLSPYNKTFRFSNTDVEAQYRSKVPQWEAYNAKLKEIERTKSTIDLDRLKYNLRSKARELMRNLMEAFQKQGLDWVDPNDSLIECWRDIFSQGAYGYSSSFEKWFDTVNHLSLDPKDTDSLYDVISNRPVDTIRIKHDSEGQMVSTNSKDSYIYTLKGYTLTTYEYHIYYYKKTVKTYDEKLNLKGDPEVTYVQKDNPKTVIADIGAYAKSKAPDGLKYITRALKPKDCASNDIIRTWIANSVSQVTGTDLNTFLEGGKPEVSELLIPSDTVPADKSQGLYDAKKLALSNSVELILSQAKDTPVPRNQFNEAVMKYSEEYMKKGAKKIAGETSVTTYELVDSIIKGKDIPSATISLITDEKVETAITSFINKVHIRYANNEFTRNILSDKALKDKFTQMVEDSFEVKNFFGAPNGKSITRILLSSKFDTNVSIAQEVSPLLAKAASERNIAVETRYYRGETHYFVEENSYREFQQQVHTETDDYLKKLDEQNKLKTKNLIDKKQYEELKNTSIGSLRFKFVKGIMESCYGTYSAIDELNEKLQKLQQTEGVDNAIVCLGLYKQVFDIQKNCVEIVNKWNNHKLSMMLKVVPCTELFGSIETETTKKIDNLMTKKKDISQLLKMNDVVTGTLGLGISTLQLIQSVRSLAESMNQNDEHIIRADMANFINAGATTVSSAKAIADTLKDQAREKLKDMAIESRAKKNLAKQGGESAADLLGRNAGKKITERVIESEAAITLIERLGIRAAAFLSIPYLGEILLVIDIATTLWAAWEEAHKDNIYQQWVKLSNLYP